MIISGLKGKAGEYRVASELMARGFAVYMPVYDHGTDLMLGSGVHIQVKTGQRISSQKPYNHTRYSFNIRSSKDRNHAIPNSLSGVDFVVLWAMEDNEFYIIPAKQIRGKTNIGFTADTDKRTQVKWNQWLPYLNNWDILTLGMSENGIWKSDQIPAKRNIEQKECKQCGHRWQPFVENATRCPKCHNRWYLEQMREVHCNQCDHKWRTRIDPVWCPKCHSTSWNKEKSNGYDIDREKVRSLYQEGKSFWAIADIMKIKYSTVYAIIRRAGLVRTQSEGRRMSRNHNMPYIDEENIKSLYVQGYSTNQISDIVKLNSGTVYQIIKRAGIIRSRVDALNMRCAKKMEERASARLVPSDQGGSYLPNNDECELPLLVDSVKEVVVSH